MLHVNFRKPAIASDSELREDDIIVRYDGDEVIGLTILHAESSYGPNRENLVRQKRAISWKSCSQTMI